MNLEDVEIEALKDARRQEIANLFGVLIDNLSGEVRPENAWDYFENGMLLIRESYDKAVAP